MLLQCFSSTETKPDLCERVVISWGYFDGWDARLEIRCQSGEATKPPSHGTVIEVFVHLSLWMDGWIDG